MRTTTVVTADMTQTASCIFCKIVRKESPSSIIYEDDLALAFLDIRPLNEGHTLIIPKTHYETIYDIPEDLLSHLYKTVKRLTLAVKHATKADGITVIQQNGRAAGQEVFHLHVHIVPRYDGQKLPRFRDIPNASREHLQQVAAKILQDLNLTE